MWWPAREIIKNAIKNRKKVYKTGEIVELEDRCPWKDHLLSLEEEMGIVGEIKFAIFFDKSKSWRVQAIPLQPDSFVCRLVTINRKVVKMLMNFFRVFLHKDWRGVRDGHLTKIAGIEGSIFCHATGFIGGNETKEGALQMAIKSLESAAD